MGRMVSSSGGPTRRSGASAHIPAPAGGDAEGRTGGERLDADVGRELLGRLGGEIPVEPEDLARTRGRVRDRAAEHGRQGVEPVLQRRDNAEVPAATAEPPQKVRPLLGARPHQAAIGGDDVRRQQVVAGKAEATH